jgi:hypothetical protein
VIDAARHTARQQRSAQNDATGRVAITGVLCRAAPSGRCADMARLAILICRRSVRAFGATRSGADQNVAGLAAVMTQGQWPRVTGRCDGAVSACHGEETPDARYSLELVLAAVDEIEARAHDKRRHGSRDEHFTRTR